MQYTIRDVRRGDPGEAALLADLWNASDAGWPGGLTRGAPMTAERMLERLERLDRLIVFTADAGGQLVGYGDVRRIHGRDDVAYGVLLNVRPDWHDKGCGKAIILAILERLTELGFRQFSIQTWSGNLRAIPLYKKTGFFWEPGTGVRLQNFIPTALVLPAARGFFSRHGWYQSFRRDLAVAPDDVRWHGTRVYPYRFEADGDLFAMVIDRKAEAPTAIETSDFSVACYTGRGEIVCAVPHAFTWEIVNKRGGGRPLRVELSAAGPAGVDLEVTESLEVTDSLRLQRPFVVSPEIGRPRPGLPLHAVTSTLVVDGVPVVLATGLATVQPIELDVQGLRPTPDKPEEVIVRLYNRLGVALAGEVSFEPRPGLAFDRAAAPFTVPAGSWASCSFRLTAGEGAHATRVRAVCAPERNPGLRLQAPLATRAQAVTFRAVPLDRVYAWEDEEAEVVTIETPTLWITAHLRGGGLFVHDRLSDQLVFRQGAPVAGPPFEGEQIPPLYEHRFEQADGRVRLTQTIPSEMLPGVIVERTLTVGAGPFLRLDHRVRNATGVEQRPRLRCPGELHLHRAVTAPLAVGLVHEIVEGLGDFPLEGGQDLPKEAAAYAEGWSAREEHGLVAGLVWKRCGEIDGGSVLFDLPAIAPRSSVDVDPLYLVVGRGDWRLVRDLWRRLWQEGPDAAPPMPRPVLSAGFEPGPLLVTAGSTAATLAVTNRRRKPLDGRWELRAAGFRAQPAGGELAGVTPGRPASRQVTLTCADLTPRVVPAAIVLRSAATIDERAAPIVVVGDAAREVSVGPADDGALLHVDNGLLSFAVAPGHHGSLVSLRRGERELLVSSFPQPRPYQWMTAWFGGVEPFVAGPGDSRYVGDTFAGQAVERRGTRGLLWRGAGVTCQVRHAETRWLTLTVEYLTIGGSNLVALVQRLTNTSGAFQEVPVGFIVFPAVTPDTRVHYEVRATEERDAVVRQRAPMPYSFRFGDARWVAMETAGATLVLTPLAPEGEAGGWLLNREAAGLHTTLPLRLEAGETREKLAWLAVVDEPRQARGYRELGALRELP
ncbi:MAG TPA: GNAT family N-acetyltransferase [Thermoanaerobaculia bacterium]